MFMGAKNTFFYLLQTSSARFVCATSLPCGTTNDPGLMPIDPALRRRRVECNKLHIYLQSIRYTKVVFEHCVYWRFIEIDVFHPNCF